MCFNLLLSFVKSTTTLPLYTKYLVLYIALFSKIVLSNSYLFIYIVDINISKIQNVLLVSKLLVDENLSVSLAK